MDVRSDVQSNVYEILGACTSRIFREWTRQIEQTRSQFRFQASHLEPSFSTAPKRRRLLLEAKNRWIQLWLAPGLTKSLSARQQAAPKSTSSVRAEACAATPIPGWQFNSSILKHNQIAKCDTQMCVLIWNTRHATSDLYVQEVRRAMTRSRSTMRKVMTIDAKMTSIPSASVDGGFIIPTSMHLCTYRTVWQQRLVEPHGKFWGMWNRYQSLTSFWKEPRRVQSGPSIIRHSKSTSFLIEPDEVIFGRWSCMITQQG